RRALARAGATPSPATKRERRSKAARSAPKHFSRSFAGEEARAVRPARKRVSASSRRGLKKFTNSERSHAPGAMRSEESTRSDLSACPDGQADRQEMQ